MFETVEEAKEWFQDQKLETKIQWVELWEGSDWDELENRTGQHYDNLVDMFEEIEEARSDADDRNSVIDELRTEGFELPVAAGMYEAAAQDTLGSDATYLRRKSEDPSQIREVSELAISKFIGKSELNSQIAVPDHLVDRADRVLAKTIAPQLIKSYDPIEGLRELFINEYKYDEEQADALFEPVIQQMDDIKQEYTYSKIIGISNDIESSISQVDQLEQRISNIDNKLEKIERQVGQNNPDDYREEDY